MENNFFHGQTSKFAPNYLLDTAQFYPSSSPHSQSASDRSAFLTIQEPACGNTFMSTEEQMLCSSFSVSRNSVEKHNSSSFSPQGAHSYDFRFHDCIATQALDRVVPNTGEPNPFYNATNNNNNNNNNNNSFWNCSSSRELSLSLSTWQNLVPDTVISIPDRCSEAGCPIALRLPSSDTSKLPESAWESTPESNIPTYLNVVHQIFSELSAFAAEGLSEAADSPVCIGHEANMSVSTCSNVERVLKSAPHELAVFREFYDTDRKRAELLTMLQLADDKYNHCIETVQTIVTAFHQAVRPGKYNISLGLSLHSVSTLYNSLRGRIVTAILSVAKRSSYGQEKKFDNFDDRSVNRQFWRPQRGLPEKSVAVLRQWMFENFLHPYPGDHEKQLLAVRSGLTKSQVSNWFINARVRLWKPMIEEIYELSEKA